MSTDELQLQKAGNAGDIVLHVSLIALLDSISPSSKRVLYVETNAFRPTSNLGNADRIKGWKKDILKIKTGRWSDAYVKLEKPYVDNGKYLCSTGIAHEKLMKVPERDVDWLLCEKAEASRAKLSRYFSNATILEDNAFLEPYLRKRKRQYNATIALVNLYHLEQVSDSMQLWLDCLCETVQGGPSAALIFDWGGKGSPSSLTLPLRGEFILGKYRLALYANNAAFQLFAEPLRTLGWNI